MKKATILSILIGPLFAWGQDLQTSVQTNEKAGESVWSVQAEYRPFSISPQSTFGAGVLRSLGESWDLGFRFLTPMKRYENWEVSATSLELFARKSLIAGKTSFYGEAGISENFVGYNHSPSEYNFVALNAGFGMQHQIESHFAAGFNAGLVASNSEVQREFYSSSSSKTFLYPYVGITGTFEF